MEHPSHQTETSKVPPLANKQNIVTCCDIHGRLVAVPSQNIRKQPAVYGILTSGAQVLLQKHPETGNLLLPGGFIDSNHSPEQALREIFHSITGFFSQIKEVVMFDEELRYINGNGYRLAIMYYRLEPPRVAPGQISFDELEADLVPRWVPLASLKRTEMQFGYDAIQLCISD